MSRTVFCRASSQKMSCICLGGASVSPSVSPGSHLADVGSFPCCSCSCEAIYLTFLANKPVFYEMEAVVSPPPRGSALGSQLSSGGQGWSST